MRKSQTLVPALYIVATPIGNLGDITLRALEVLKGVDLIACEDTRMSARLLSHYGIKARTLSYHDHNADAQRPFLLSEITSGKSVALISDAGTPLISDPGYKLVRDAGEQGITVIPIPGVSSVTTALSVCGLPTDRFLFIGFLPTKDKARTTIIESLATTDATLVFFESARRLDKTLPALLAGLGNRETVVARELTKLHEELRRAPLAELITHYEQAGEPKGEVVLLVAPPQEESVTTHDVDALLTTLLAEMSVKDAATEVARITSLPRQEIYARALLLKGAR